MAESSTTGLMGLKVSRRLDGLKPIAFLYDHHFDIVPASQADLPQVILDWRNWGLVAALARRGRAKARLSGTLPGWAGALPRLWAVRAAFTLSWVSSLSII